MIVVRRNRGVWRGMAAVRGVRPSIRMHANAVYDFAGTGVQHTAQKDAIIDCSDTVINAGGCRRAADDGGFRVGPYPPGLVELDAGSRKTDRALREGA